MQVHVHIGKKVQIYIDLHFFPYVNMHLHFFYVPVFVYAIKEIYIRDTVSKGDRWFQNEIRNYKLGWVLSDG